ncbi:GntR family transcriptional regulator [Roseibacillus persicicus]|uniref:GntR family transcriptional regulator n=1 Tax=Roseibacillus persicicus TaxID=454148 RepID=A0A918TH86_9BACT|nr:GntR family transcriptional regulator [Roseibacillus persicicus]GHC45991.1 GntR family transcriptional regulator [Roseibacillus persicicus]
MLPFSLQLKDGFPVSEQILSAVRKAVLTGQLKEGDLFPSVRSLSQELTISPTTAHKVVSQLKSAGYLVARPGIGMVVGVPDLPNKSERINLLSPACQDLLAQAQELGLDLDDVLTALRNNHRKSS